MNGWPTPEQLMLLQASLSSSPKALEAWKGWTQQIDFDKIDPASYNLLPLVARNPAFAALQDPILEKCRGIYRQVWVSNHLNWNRMLPVLSQLLEVGVDKIVLLKGMAMVLQYYQDFGVRVMGDIDILIERSQLLHANAFLQANGWKPRVPLRFDINNQEHLNRWHAINFTHANGLNLDLHWSLIEENTSILDQAALDGSQLLSSQLHILNATDLLLQTCIHGTKQSPVPLIRWIADATTILKHAEIDWERFIELAGKAHVCLPLSLALHYLIVQFDAPIPEVVIRRLKTTSSIRLEHLEQRCHSRGYCNIAAWYRYCLNKGHLTLTQQIVHMPHYVQSTARLKSLWQVPFFAIYWPFKYLSKKYLSFIFK